MKKVIIFLLTAALALGLIGYGHASVSAQQERLLVYPTLETGDASVLAGKTAELSFLCGDHLRWDTRHTFGGATETAFTFSPKGFLADSGVRARLEVYFSGNVSASTSGGSFSFGASPYAALMQAAAAPVGDGEAKTSDLHMADYVDHYFPDLDLQYETNTAQCNLQRSLHGQLTGDAWYEQPEDCDDFFAGFRFPVQPGHIMSVTIEKDDMRRIVGYEVNSQNGPELFYFSHVDENGIWFVPIFRDLSGTPLPYESPMGHGIYHAPWKVTAVYEQSDRTVENLAPDMAQLELVLPLEQSLEIRHMVFDPEGDAAWMLTLENGFYTLTHINLSTGQARSVPVLEKDPDSLDDFPHFVRCGGYLLVTAENRIALVRENDLTLELTAPDNTEGQTARTFDPQNGSLFYDGSRLYLAETTYHYDGAFWAAVWQQEELLYYGEYDCNLLRGNDDWYYATVDPHLEPLILGGFGET